MSDYWKHKLCILSAKKYKPYDPRPDNLTDEHLSDDKEKSLINLNPYLLDIAPKSVRNNLGFILHLVENCENPYEIYNRVPHKISDNPKFCIAYVKRTGTVQPMMNAQHRSRELFLEILKTPHTISSYESETVMSFYSYDRFHPSAFEKFLDDKELMLLMVSRDSSSGSVLSMVKSKPMGNDPDVVRAALSYNGMNLLHAKAKWKRDRDMVITAVSQNGHAIQYANPKFLDDHGVALAAVSHKSIYTGANHESGHALAFFYDRLKADRDIALAAVMAKGSALEQVSGSLRMDYDVAHTAVVKSENPESAFRYVDISLRLDQTLVKQALCHCEHVLAFCSYRDRSDKSIVLEAVKYHGNAIAYASEELQMDREVVITSAHSCLSRGVDFDIKRYEENGPLLLTIALEMVRYDGRNLDKFRDYGAVMSDREIITTAMRGAYTDSIVYVPRHVFTDSEFVELVVSSLRHGRQQIYVSESIPLDVRIWEHPEIPMAMVVNYPLNLSRLFPAVVKRDWVKLSLLALQNVVDCSALKFFERDIKTHLEQEDIDFLYKVAALKSAWRKTRWLRLVHNILRFHREDELLKKRLHPSSIVEVCVETSSSEFTITEPKDPKYWSMIMRKRQRLN